MPVEIVSSLFNAAFGASPAALPAASLLSPPEAPTPPTMGYGLLLLRGVPMLLSTAAVNFSFNQILFLRPFLWLPSDLRRAAREAKDAKDARSARRTKRDRSDRSDRSDRGERSDRGDRSDRDGRDRRREPTGRTSDPAPALTAAAARGQTNALLQHFVRRQFPAGFTAILVLYPLTWLAAGANLALSGPLGRAGLSGLSRFTRHLAGAAGRRAAAALTLPPLARRLYVAGLVFSVGHMLFGPRAKNLMERIGRLGAYDDKAPEDSRSTSSNTVGASSSASTSSAAGSAVSATSQADKDVDKDADKDALALLQTWLRLHAVRSLVADVPAWLCFTAAFMLSRPFR